jgi:ABC-type polysaccharide/polyol phosphate export permease
VARYKRSVLGVAWTMLNPLGTMLIMVLVFSRVFNEVESYSTYVLTGIICWTMFQQSTSFAMSSMVWGSRLFQQIYMPRTSFVISTVLAGLVNFILSLVPLFIIMAFSNVQFKLTLLLLPFSMLILFTFSLGVSLLVSTLAVFFPDVAEMYPVLLLAWMYLSPIIIPVEILEEVLNGLILTLNPFFYVVNIFRLLVYDGVFPSALDWGLAFLVSFIFLVSGWTLFTKKADKFAYHV